MSFRHSITLEQALAMSYGALAHARENTLNPMTVVVLDASGCMKTLLREDGSSLAREKIALGKARGALSLGLGGRDLEHRWTHYPNLITAVSDFTHGEIVAVRGSVLLRDADGTILGAIGVTGDSAANDEACAMAGASAAGMTGDPGTASV